MPSGTTMWLPTSLVHCVELRPGRQLAEQDQIRRFEVGAVLGQLLDRIAPIHQDALVAVDEGDRGSGRRRCS